MKLPPAIVLRLDAELTTRLNFAAFPYDGVAVELGGQLIIYLKEEVYEDLKVGKLPDCGALRLQFSSEAKALVDKYQPDFEKPSNPPEAN